MVAPLSLAISLFTYRSACNLPSVCQDIQPCRCYEHQQERVERWFWRKLTHLILGVSGASAQVSVGISEERAGLPCAWHGWFHQVPASSTAAPPQDKAKPITSSGEASMVPDLRREKLHSCEEWGKKCEKGALWAPRSEREEELWVPKLSWSNTVEQIFSWRTAPCGEDPSQGRGRAWGLGCRSWEQYVYLLHHKPQDLSSEENPTC